MRKKIVKGASLKLQRKEIKSSSALIPKHQHPHLAVLTPTRKATLTQPSASDRPRMSGESPLALAGARIPDFHHAVFAAGDEA